MEHTTHDDGYGTSLPTHGRSEQAASAPLRVDLPPLPKRQALIDEDTSHFGFTSGVTGCHDIDILQQVAAGLRLRSDESERRKHAGECDTARLQQEIDGVIARWRASHGEVGHDR